MKQMAAGVCRMQISFMEQPPPNLRRSQTVSALHGPNAATELAVLDALVGLSSATLPLLPALLSLPQPGPGVAGARSADEYALKEASEVAKAFGLNREQTDALNSTVPWFTRPCKVSCRPWAMSADEHMYLLKDAHICSAPNKD